MASRVVPASFPSLEVVEKRVGSSRWARFRSENGCYPWGLSRPLTCFLSIPGIGIIPSLVCWGWKGQQVDKVNDAIMKRRSVSQVRDEESGDASSSLITAEIESAANSTTQTDMRERRRLLEAQRSNSAVIFFANTILSVIVMMAILQRYHKL